MNLAAAANKETPLTAERLEAARLRFAISCKAFATGKRRTPWFLPWGAVAVGTAVLALSAVILIRQRPVGPSPEALLASASKAEQNLNHESTSVHQVFRVQIADGHGNPESLPKKLSVWSEAKNGRFTARLERTGGVLEHAVWVSDRRHAYRYDFASVAGPSAGLSAKGAGLVDEVAKSGVSAGEVEAAFVHWLRSRPWKPISLSSEMVSFVSGDGALLSAERVASAGVPILRLTARKTIASVTAIMVLQVEEGQFRVRAASLRLENEERRIDLRLVPENVGGETASFTNVLFEPDRKLLKFVTPINGSLAVFRSPELVVRQPLANPSPRQILVEEIELDFALHRIGACAGEQIEVSRSGAGLNVIGMARSAARKSEWLAALNSPQLPGWVRLNLQTPEDVLKQMSNDSPPAVSAGPPVSVRLLDSSHFLVEGAIDQYLKAGGMEGDSSHFAESSLKKTESILAEAAALNQLVAVGGQTELARLPPSSEALVRTMVFDHLLTLRRLTSGLREKVAPALSPLSNRARDSANQTPDHLNDRAPWTSAAPAIAMGAQRLYRTAVVLFGPKSGEMTGTSEDADQTATRGEVIDFFETLQRMEDRARIAAQDLGTFSSARN